ncbi:MAG: hypothetical protein ACYCYF_05200 [Anaerolineae bacterium]
MSLLPTLPIIAPLIGIPFCSLLRYPAFGKVTRRVAYASVIGLTALSLAIVWARSGSIAPDIHPDVGYLVTPASPLWSPLGLWAASLVLFVLLIGQLTETERPLTAARSAHYLIILSAAIATVSAANSVSLVIAWCIPQWLITYLRVSQTEGTERISRWDTWAGFASMALIILGATASTSEQSGSLYLIQFGPGLAFTAFALAAGLRLLSWPLAGGRGRWWQLHALSLVTGFYLWLRIGVALNVEGTLASHPLVAVIVGLTFGILIGPREEQSRVVPYGFGYWLAIALLAPILDPDKGYAVSLLVGTQLMLCLLILRGHPIDPAGLWMRRMSLLVARAAQGGFILTSGFIAQWIFGQICLQTGGLALLAVASAGCLAAAIPLWRRLTLLFGSAEEQVAVEVTRRLSYVFLAISGILIVLGLWPGLIARLWPDIRLGLSALEYAELWGDSGSERLALTLAIVLIPGLPGLLGRRVPWSWDPVYAWLDRAGHSLKGEWLYLLGQRALARATRMLRTSLQAVEESLPLGWSLLWLVALAYYLLQR